VPNVTPLGSGIGHYRIVYECWMDVVPNVRPQRVHIGHYIGLGVAPATQKTATGHASASNGTSRKKKGGKK